MSCFLNLLPCLLPSPRVRLHPRSSAAPEGGQSLPAEVSPGPNRDKLSPPISYRWRSWSHHAEFVLFTTASDCWLGLCFTVISRSFPVVLLYLSLFSILFLCLFFFPLNCSSLHLPLLSFILWISGNPSTLPIWFLKLSSKVLGAPSHRCHLQNNSVCMLSSLLSRPLMKTWIRAGTRIKACKGPTLKDFTILQWISCLVFKKDVSVCPTSRLFPIDCVSLPCSWHHKRQCQKSLTKIFICCSATIQQVSYPLKEGKGHIKAILSHWIMQQTLHSKQNFDVKQFLK